MPQCPSQYQICIFLLLIHHLYELQSLTLSTTPPIKFRPGKSSDEFQISLTMAQNLMNPININSNRFIVAVDPTNDTLCGWAQLRPIGSNTIDLNTYNAAPGSGSIEKEIDEEIWDDFENDIEFPNGFASLPWTKEYREFAKASEKRRAKRNYMSKLAKEEKKNDMNQLWELASVYVAPDKRNQGIGSKLVQTILDRHVNLGRSMQDVYLLTLDRRKKWYEKFGFGVTKDPPASMALEIGIGGVLTRILGEELVAMRGN